MAVFAVFLLGFVIALTRAAKRRLEAEYRQIARQPADGGDWDEDDDELAQMYMYGNADGPRQVQNPLYCAMQGDDDAHMDGNADTGGPRPVENPLYSGMQSGDDTDKLTVDNEIYESGLASDDLAQPTWMESTDGDDNMYADIDASRKQILSMFGDLQGMWEDNPHYEAFPEAAETDTPTPIFEPDQLPVYKAVFGVDGKGRASAGRTSSRKTESPLHKPFNDTSPLLDNDDVYAELNHTQNWTST